MCFQQAEEGLAACRELSDKPLQRVSDSRPRNGDQLWCVCERIQGDGAIARSSEDRIRDCFGMNESNLLSWENSHVVVTPHVHKWG